MLHTHTPPTVKREINKKENITCTLPSSRFAYIWWRNLLLQNIIIFSFVRKSRYFFFTTMRIMTIQKEAPRR
jgi:hypothetical protein